MLYSWMGNCSYRIQQIFSFSSGNLNINLNTTFYLHLLLIKTVLVMDKATIQAHVTINNNQSIHLVISFVKHDI
jgi:hypothetical protein